MKKTKMDLSNEFENNVMKPQIELTQKNKNKNIDMSVEESLILDNNPNKI